MRFCLALFISCLVLHSVGSQDSGKKLLWSVPVTGPCILLTTTPDSKELLTLQYKMNADQSVKLQLVRSDLAGNKEVSRIELEEIDTPLYSSTREKWQRVGYHASPDGKTLLVSINAPDRSNRHNVYGFQHVQRYDVATGKRVGDLIEKLIALQPGLRSMEGGTCFSPDGQYFWAFGKGYGHELNVYSIATGKVILTEKMVESERAPQSIAFSSDSNRAVIYWKSSKGNSDIAIYSLPEAKKLKEFTLPAGQMWQQVCSLPNNKIGVEVMEEDERSKEQSQPNMPHPIQAWSVHCYTLNISVDDPLSTLKKEPSISGFRGQSMGIPTVYWDAGSTWVANFTQHQHSQEVIQAAASSRKQLAYYSWHDATVVDTRSGKPVLQLKGLPYQCQVTPDGRYLVGVGPSPQCEDGIHVWQVQP